MELTSTALSQYALEVSVDDFSRSVIDQAERLLLDSLGCAVGAFPSKPSKVLRETYGCQRAPGGGSTLLGTGRTIPMEYAALINGAMVRYFDYNDCYISGSSVCHPSDHIPALLAVAEAEERSGAEFIESLVVAYEVMGALVDTGAIWDEGFDYVTWGLYSGAAAVGKLMGLSERELINAMGIAGASSNGLLASRLGTVSMWKGVAQSFAIHNAVKACQMARAGLTGPKEIFEGSGGFFEVVSKRPVEIDSLAGWEGTDFRILRTNYKPYACGYFMQAPITAVQELLTEHEFTPQDIESIEIEEFDQAVQVLASPEKWSNDLNRETADHSLPYSVAVSIVDGEVTPRQYEPDRLSDQRVLELMQKVRVTESDEMTQRRANNPGIIPARARIETEDATVETSVDYPIGHWKHPMSDERLEQKFTDLVAGLLDERQRAEAIEACYSVENAEGLGALLDSVRV